MKRGRLRVQCKACPWKVSTDPKKDIPGGYCERKHEALKNTIAKPADLSGLGNPIRVMACHETTGGRELACVGWLVNQLGDGNNIPLRMAVMLGAVDGNVKTVGPQHARLEDTLPLEEKNQ